MAAPDDEDEIAKVKRPIPFPRSPDGMSVAQMQEYIKLLDAEKAKFQREIDSRDGVKNAAEALFKKSGQ
jgi:uncharacterized small protein (DUF1192 family)